MKIVRVADLPALAGQEVGVSSWITIDQQKIDTFAEATGDNQWIHVDPDRAARELPTKCTIAHGYLTLSLISVVADEVLKIKDAVSVINSVIGRYFMNSPIIPGQNTSGMNAASVVAVEAVIGHAMRCAART